MYRRATHGRIWQCYKLELGDGLSLGSNKGETLFHRPIAR
uniref:Uncharacterized protein n=1 Tax=Arundo donax TaxID=35708 RepID=A0A0A9CAL0_ARUDO